MWTNIVKRLFLFGNGIRGFSRFAFRAGLQSDPFVPSIGVGAGSSRFSFDTVALWHPQLGVNVALRFHSF